MMIANGVISFPSSQILYIITGYFIFTGDLHIALVVFCGALGNTIGCIILYEATRQKGLDYILKWKIFPQKKIQKIIQKITVALHKKGLWFLFVGKFLPTIKVFIPIVAGIGNTRRELFIPLMFISSIIWTAPFLTIGYYFGKSSDLFGKYAVVMIFITVVIVGLFYKYINSKEVLDEIQN